MRYYIFLFIGFLCAGSFSDLQAQNPPLCTCDFQITPIGPCCATLDVRFMGTDCLTGQVNYQDIFLSNGDPSFPGNFVSWTNEPGINLTSSISTSGTIMSLNTTGNLANSTNIGNFQTLGTICYSDVPGGLVRTSIAVVDNGPTGQGTCESQTDVLLNCPPVPMNCTCYGNLVPTDQCCALLTVEFDPGCPNTNASFTNVQLGTTSTSFPGEIVSWTTASGIPSITSSFNTGNTGLTLNSSANLVNAVSTSGPQTLGTVCFDNAPAGIVPTRIIVSGNVMGTPSFCETINEVPVDCPPPGDWAKIYGDNRDNRPTRVKSFTDGVYVAGTVVVNSDVYGTMSKFDLSTGNLVWEYRLDFPGAINDFEYDPAIDALILVGTKGPVGFGNSSLFVSDESFILKISDTGGLLQSNVYAQPGREGFTRIVRHPNPCDSSFPYYVLGRKNPASNAPSGFDLPVIYNIGPALNVKTNGIRHYDAGIEVEAYRGLIPLADGNLFVVGNSSNANEGALFEIDGCTLAEVGTAYYPGVIDIYDGVDMTAVGVGGEVALAGHDFGADMGLVYVIDRSTYQVLDGLRFPDVSLFTEIGLDSGGDIYTLALTKNQSPDFHVMHRLSYINGIAGRELGIRWMRYLENGETAFDAPHFSVTPNDDAIFYADGRQNNPGGFGDYDIWVGSYDLDLTDDCQDIFFQLQQNYTIGNQPYVLSDPVQPEPSSTLQYSLLDPGYACEDPCLTPCTADFTWTSDCCELDLMGSATGTGPFTYEWDFQCDGSVDATGQSATLSNLPLGSNVLCLKITDATGCMATVQQTVNVVGDNTPPVVNCPSDITVVTDPGECFATFSISMPIATDDCDDELFVICSLSGATTAPIGPVNELPKGVTTVTCATEDDKGNFASCTYDITVVDQEPPVITCPGPINTSVAACAGGFSVQFPDPMVSDNCPMVSWTYSHQSGDFFPCGTTTVTATATDMAGNQSTCSFPITVDCQCAEVGGETISCTDVDDQFAFSVSVIDLTGSGTNGCTVSVSSPQSGITISGVTTTGSGPGYTVSGLIDVAAPPMPNTINIVVSVSCVCPDGTVHDCDFPITLQTPCCKDISVDPQEVCENGPSVQIPLVGCGNLYDVQQVRWYVADAPCPPASWGPPLQVTNGCAPLTLSPQFHNGDICVYAEVDMGPDAGPCTMLTSNIATINLCPPISCDLSGGQAYCYTGSPITPAPLSLTLNPVNTDCDYTIEWFDPNGNLIPSATGTTIYQPPALDFTLSNTECSQSYTYTAKVTSVCGEQSCSATFRLDNDDAPVGTINLLPPDVNPLCYGEDAVLEYIPECAGDPERWDWFIRPDVVPAYTPLLSNGRRNPLYYTNRLYEDTWVKVEKTNGICPADEIEFFLDIIDPLTINSFTAEYSPVCTPAAVDLEVDFNPSPAPAGCTYTIFWYKGINRIHTSTHTSATAMYTYTPPPGVGLAGNYYCIIESSCCPQREKSDVVILEPPMEVYAVGPCYRCNCETVTLNGIVLYPIPGYNCTYQWYDNGVPITGATGTSLTVDPQWDGPFTFEVKCTNGTNTCVQSDVYTLLQCGLDPINPVQAICPTLADITIDASGVATLPANIGTGLSTDNCGTPSESSPSLTFDCTQLGTQTVTLTADDGYGNTDTDICSFAVTDPGGNCGNGISCSPNPVILNLLIGSGTYRSVSTIESAGTISSSSTVLFTAGQSITLNPGFTASAGSSFTARIEACNPISEDPVDALEAQADQGAAEEPFSFMMGTEEELEEDQLYVFPNPFKNQVNITLNLTEEKAVDMRLFDMNGKMIAHILPLSLQQAGGNYYTLAGDRLAPGVYILVVRAGEQMYNRRLVVIR